MRAVIQRVRSAEVSVEGKKIAEIGRGLLVLLAVEERDTESDLNFLKRKVIHLRIFNDEEGRMNRSVEDVQGELLIVSQFTLYGDCRKGNRPSFGRAANPDKAREYYARFCRELNEETDLVIREGEFQAMMEVSLLNDGPVTVIVDSKKDLY